MTIRNRELSQFGSFIYVDNSTQEIGITTGALPYVGIGTTNPQYKLDINGDTNISGDLTVSQSINASSFFLNGDSLVNASLDRWESGTGDNIYRLNGNVGIGFSNPSERLSVNDNVSASRFISTVSTGTAPPFTVTSTDEVTNLNASLLRGGVPGQNINANDIVTLGDTQTLANKIIAGTGIVFDGSSSGVTTVRASAAASGTVLLPAISGVATVVTTGDTGTVTSNMIADLNITNSDISTTAAIVYSKLSLTGSIVNADIVNGTIQNAKISNSTISGVSLGSSLNNLTAGSFITYSSGSTYNGSAARTISVAATTANTGDRLVARNASGDFSAGTVTVLNLTATQTVAAESFNIDTNQIITNSRNLINVVGGNFSGIVTALTLSSTNLSATNGNFSGIVTATGFVGPLTGTATGLSGSPNITVSNITATNGNFSGIVTATSFNVGSNQIITNSRNLINVIGGNFSGIVTATGFVGPLTGTATGLSGSPNITVSNITATNGNFSGIVTATDFNSLSDINLKENIHTVENPTQIIQSLRGVSFDWKESGKSSYGVIAQELEEILPELVNTGEVKSVNYNGIIGVLIESIKELSIEIEELKRTSD